MTPTTFQALSAAGLSGSIGCSHAECDGASDLSRQADLIPVAPASADFLARIAHGMADDLLATMVLARDCPLLVAPAMNRQMWETAGEPRSRSLRADAVTVWAGRVDRTCAVRLGRADAGA